MLRGNRQRVIAVALVVAAACFALALGVVADLRAGAETPPEALDRAHGPSDVFPAEAAQALETKGFDTRLARKVAQDTYLVERRAHGENLLCVVSTHGNRASGGCNPKDSFFARQPLVWGLDEEGLPSAPTALWISGLARPHVDTVRLRFRGTALSTKVTEDGGFFTEATSEALAEGRPTVLEAVDPHGRIITKVPLPQS